MAMKPAIANGHGGYRLNGHGGSVEAPPQILAEQQRDGEADSVMPAAYQLEPRLVLHCTKEEDTSCGDGYRVY